MSKQSSIIYILKMSAAFLLLTSIWFLSMTTFHFAMFSMLTGSFLWPNLFSLAVELSGAALWSLSMLIYTEAILPREIATVIKAANEYSANNPSTDALTPIASPQIQSSIAETLESISILRPVDTQERQNSTETNNNTDTDTELSPQPSGVTP